MMLRHLEKCLEVGDRIDFLLVHWLYSLILYVYLIQNTYLLWIPEHGDRICGFLFEPIQGEAGVCILNLQNSLF